MGLLSKSLLFSKKEKENAESGGPLSRAQAVPDSSERIGETEVPSNSEKPEDTEKTDTEESESAGLLKKAEALLKVGGAGLLQKALSISVEEGVGKGLLERASEIGEEEAAEIVPTEKLEEVISTEVESEAVELEEKKAPQEKIEAEEKEMRLPVDVDEEAVIEEEAKAVKAEVTAEEVPSFQEPIEIPVAAEKEPSEAGIETTVEAEKEALKEEEEAKKTVPELFKQYVDSEDTVEILLLADSIIKTEGYSSFFDKLAETFMKLGKGKAVIFYILSGERYVAQSYFPEDTEMKKIVKKNFRKSSKLAEYLNTKRIVVRATGIKSDPVLKETAHLGRIKPWLMVPFLSVGELSGFIIVANQAKKPKINRENLVFFAHSVSQYLGRYIAERDFVNQMERLEKERDDQAELVHLYDLRETVQRDLEQLLKALYATMGVESAAFVSGWGEKGKLCVLHSVGLSERILKNYKVAKNDKEIIKIIESREPDIPKDYSDRVASLSKEREDGIKTYITVPVIFEDEIFGIINVHKMKGVGLKPSRGVKSKLSHGAKSIIPYLLYWKIKNSDPFKVVESLVQEETANARRLKKTLHFIVFNIESSIKLNEFPQYFALFSKLYEVALNKIGDKGIVKRVDFDKSMVILKDTDDIEADDIIKKIKQEFHRRIAKTKQGAQLTSLILRYPQESKDVREIIARIYQIF